MHDHIRQSCERKAAASHRTPKEAFGFARTEKSLFQQIVEFLRSETRDHYLNHLNRYSF